MGSVGRLVTVESDHALDPCLEASFPSLFLCVPTQVCALVDSPEVLMKRAYHLIDKGVRHDRAG